MTTNERGHSAFTPGARGAQSTRTAPSSRPTSHARDPQAADWAEAQTTAAEAAAVLTQGSPTPDDVRAFVNQYGDACAGPFFAQALAERVTPEQLTQFLIGAEAHRSRVVDKDGSPGTGYDAILDTLVADLGSVAVLSTGGMNADPSVAQTQEAFTTARADLETRSHETVDSFIVTRLGQWATIGNTLYDAVGQPVPQDQPYQGGTVGQHYGYEYLATMLSNAAVSNPNLALGPEFLTGEGCVAHDVVAFDHAHGEQIAQAGGYGNWGTAEPPGGDSYLTDPVESMLRLMDEPAAFSDGTLESSPSWATLSATNDARFDAVQTFLTDETTFDVDASQEAARQPPVALDGPMNMTRYLTSYRDRGLSYTGTQDLGDTLGRVLAQAAVVPDPPADAVPGTPQYEAWHERDRRSAEIAGNFLLGYQEGLEITGDTYKGQDGYGMQHATLRNWAGLILGNHIEGIAGSLNLPGRTNLFGAATLDPSNRHTIVLSYDLAYRILGTSDGGNGLFTDLAFDAPTDDNGTPDDLSDDLSATGRNTALATLYTAATTGYQDDMSAALATDGFEGPPIVQSSWASVFDAVRASPPQATAEVDAAVKTSNAHLRAMIWRGLGSIAVDDALGTGHTLTEWLIGQTKHGVPTPPLETFLRSDPSAAAEMSTEEAIEASMSDSIYQAISTGDYWGDPPITPQDFLAATGFADREDFTSSQGAVIPFHDMTEDQRNAFRQYVTGDGGLGPLAWAIFDRASQALDHAKFDRERVLQET